MARKPKPPTDYEKLLLIMPSHIESIIRRYGMPPKAKPPQLPEDVLERVIQDRTITNKMWNAWNG